MLDNSHIKKISDIQHFSYRDLEKLTTLSAKSWHRILSGSGDDDRIRKIEDGKRVLYFKREFIEKQVAKYYDHTQSFDDLFQESEVLETQSGLTTSEDLLKQIELLKEMYEKTLTAKDQLIVQMADRISSLESQLRQKDDQMDHLHEIVTQANTIAANAQTIARFSQEEKKLLEEKNRKKGFWQSLVGA